ncbi:unnamed protein product [Pieris macdunnoughi]|uniref:Uncharacterized protein n=1 Tax=Pieris macdunnoughi TaxID=345717 RepID=A0A821SS20_9NEOP|nr:unnamed protein product [Pieris macdunnoughi]
MLVSHKAVSYPRPCLFCISMICCSLTTFIANCYADDSTGDIFYTGRAGISRAVVDEYRNKLVSEVETLLRGVSDWARLNLVQFNPKKTQVCAFSPKKTAFVATPLFEDTLLKASASIGLLGVDISNNVQFRGHLKGKAKLASKSLVCSARRDGTSLRATACNSAIKRKFGPTWNTVLTSGRELPSTSSFHLTVFNEERFEWSTTCHFPCGLIP